MPADSVLIPHRLRRGDRIGLFAPAGPVRDHDRLAAGFNLLQDLGFRPWQPRSQDSGHPYLAADDRDRVAEFHNLWADDDIPALMAVRGGYGCLRIVDSLDFDLIRSKPKLLIGFSDVTVLLNVISQRTGLLTLHGPVVSSLAAAESETLAALSSFLSGELREYRFSRQTEALRPGRATGTLCGGNLATVVHLIGTPWEIDMEGVILFLEDTGEPMYKIDRMLTQLHYSGRLDRLAGLILGSFDGQDATDRQRLQEQVWDRVLALTRTCSYPVLGGFPAGHRAMNLPLPIGAPAILDTGTGKLILQGLN